MRTGRNQKARAGRAQTEKAPAIRERWGCRKGRLQAPLRTRILNKGVTFPQSEACTGRDVLEAARGGLCQPSREVMEASVKAAQLGVREEQGKGNDIPELPVKFALESPPCQLLSVEGFPVLKRA